MLRLKLAKIREEQMKEVGKIEPQTLGRPLAKVVSVHSRSVHFLTTKKEDLERKVQRKIDLDELEAPDLDDEQKEMRWKYVYSCLMNNWNLQHWNSYERGGYSPTYQSMKDTMPGIEILDEEADMKDMLQRRQQNKKQPAGATKLEAEMLAIARKGMESDEATFSVEQPLEAQSHLWSDKYRPRKPTYLNRVQTGFDWNKYNQTHYDMDNPPPKIVQGYKFNIFYPDLLDPTITPSFTVTPCDDPDFAVLRFKAGPPYEDIAFKCVNREWEMSLKDSVVRLLFTVNDTGFILMSAAIFLVDSIITFLIIQKVPYTEIDWSTYMQQVECYTVKNIRNYSEIGGDTGPVVYPAGHLWTYSVLHALTNAGKNIRAAQYIFMGLYLLNLLAVLRLYYKSNKVFLSPRLHLALLSFHLVVLMVFGYRMWFRSHGGIRALAMDVYHGVLTKVGVGDLYNCMVFRRLLRCLPCASSSAVRFIAAEASSATAEAPAKHVVFDRQLKRKQRDWAVRQPNFEDAQYLKEEIGWRVADRVFDLTKFNPLALDIGCGVGHIAPHMIKENVGTLIQCDMSEEMVNKSNGANDSEVLPVFRDSEA
ncbi:hypothetical protein OSTOST_11107 [Ostertagia ostertagi]